MMDQRCSVLIVFLGLIGCGPNVQPRQPSSDNTEGVAGLADSDDTIPSEVQAHNGSGNCCSQHNTHQSVKENVPFVIDLTLRSEMRERYCQSTGYECKETGWAVPEIAKKFGSVERAVDGILRVMHTYESKEGWFLIRFARKGEPVTAWEIDIKNRDGRHAIFDLDCDGVFEVKALKGYPFVTLPCAKLE